jgi:hypothetical protein
VSVVEIFTASKLAGPDPCAWAKLGGRQFAASSARLCDDDVVDRHAPVTPAGILCGWQLFRLQVFRCRIR